MRRNVALKTRIAGLILVCACLGCTVLAQAQEGVKTLVINTSQSFPRATPEGRGFQDVLLKEVMARAGRKAVVVSLPSERCLINANQGVDDGNVVRVGEMEELYPNLRRVQEAFSAYNYMVFTKDYGLRFEGLDDLRKYRVAIITGWKILEGRFKNFEHLEKAVDAKSLFEMLRSDRVDLVVFEALQGREMVKLLGLEDVVCLGPPLLQERMYMYLHKKHEDLLEPLAKALREMKKDGSFQQIVNSVLFGPGMYE